MAKITLNGIVSGFKSVAKLISNFDSIEDNLNNKVLYRDNPEGEPNQMESELDMNSNRILNLPTATSATEPVTYGQFTGPQTPSEFDKTVVENHVGSDAVANKFTLGLTSYSPGLQNLSVYINGVRQLNSTYTETSPTEITFGTTPVDTDEYTFVVNEVNVDNDFYRDAGGRSLVESFVATAGQTVITLSNTYTQYINNVSVYRNGVRQSDFVETSPSSITLTDPASAGDEIVVIINEAFVIQGTSEAANVVYTPQGAGAVGTNVQAKLQQVVSVKDFGAVGDGVTDDRDAINEAIQSLETVGGGVLHFPKGVFRISANSGIIFLNTDITLKGEGLNESIIFYDKDNTPSSTYMFKTSNLDQNNGNPTTHKFSMDGMCIRGTWSDNEDFSEWRGTFIFLESNTGEVKITNSKFEKCHFMPLVVEGASSVTVDSCVFEKSVRDGCRLIHCSNVLVSNNSFKFINDDAIAVHSKSSLHSDIYMDNNAVITNNIITDSQGIACQGLKKATIANNVLTRCHSRGILVGVGDTEGDNTLLGITIANNTITDMFRPLTFGAGGGNCSYICVINGTPTASNGYVGQSNGTTINSPYDGFYNVATSSTPPTGNTWFININGNTCIRTLEPTASYSDYGFPDRYTRSGIFTGSVDEVALGSIESLIEIEDLAFNTRITNNNLYGAFRNAIDFLGTVGSAYTSWSNVVVSDNTIANFETAGIYCRGEGNISISNNLFDGDPSHVHSSRTSGGTWGASFVDHSCVWVDGVDIHFAGNQVRNTGSVFRGNLVQSSNAMSEGNIAYCNPVTDGPYNASNVGIGNVGANFANSGFILAVEDGDPASSTYGKLLNACVLASDAIPSGSEKYVRGHFIKNRLPTVQGSGGSQYVITGWLRLTTGTGHVLNTDWVEMRTLTGT